MEKELLTAERLIINLKLLDEIPPSQWNEATVLRGKVLMRLISKFLSGEKIYVKKLDDRPVIDKAREVFE